jgi:hypothetical protein
MFSTGEQTSNIIMMSDPKLDCISTTFEGVKKCLAQLLGDLK